MTQPSLSTLFTDALRASFPWLERCRGLPPLPGASAALAGIALSRLRPAAPVLVVAAGAGELDALHADTLVLAEHGDTPLYFPPVEGEAPNADLDLQGFRHNALRALRRSSGVQEFGSSGVQNGPQNSAISHPPSAIILTSIYALQQKTTDPASLDARTRRLAKGGIHDFTALIEWLVENGYARQHETVEKGCFSVHGGVVDIWPATRDTPVRAEFFGDTIESLRRFDPATQASVEKITGVDIPPCASAAHLRAQHSLLRFMPPGSTILWLDHDRLALNASQREQDFPGSFSFEALRKMAAAIPGGLEVFSGDPAPEGVANIPLPIAPFAGLADLRDDLRHPDALASERQKLLADLAQRAAGGAVVRVCVDTAGACELVTRELLEGGAGSPLPAALGSQQPSLEPQGGAEGFHALPVSVHKLPLSGGFALDTRPPLVVAGQPDLYATRKTSGRRAAPPTEPPRGAGLESLADLGHGDLVVHLDYGIGTFAGATEVDMDGRRVEVFTLEYADNTRVHVPVSHTHLVSRYVGVKGHRVKIHRVGGKRWSREKHEAERAVMDLASSLLETQARRQTTPGFAFVCDLPWMGAFEAAFPHTETPDQARVIRDVKADLASTRPMDRLVCGDAGYGKTEIAMRAAFVAVMNGRQAALLAPTTILVEQHLGTFRDRMAGYPLRIEALSSFRSAAERQAILGQLASGAIDIVIGTHALLQPGVAFKDLGLLVIDEEQRFGVAHKEALKRFRATVDILTLTATPIPRTLHMAMTGARDMSLLQTPPRERLPVETRVARDTDGVVAAAIRDELARDGQVYFLHNRVATLHLVRRRLERLAPGAAIAVAHGQMPPSELAPVMRAFESGRTQILLCTTLVENGLDIPRANTLIVHRADRFGIADLYQLRGRVGRSSRKGHALFLLPEHGHIDEDARQRIAALKRHTGLGAGYHLALRDLELRGGGSLLGSRQSGHIAAVGFTLYCQLLKRTIARARGEAPPALVDVTLALDFVNLSPSLPDDASAASLPYSYVEDEPHRVALYRRLAEASEAGEVRALRGEMRDRFGPLPAPVLRLLRMNEIRVLAARRGLRRVEASDGKVRLFRDLSRDPVLINNRLPALKPAPASDMLDALFRIVEKLPKPAE
ncbi:MAG: transcription-repair coupling factor [Kiritimatiellaeota bacterium]|nr:transcription-repair coupling factor [Kiritimatiellota bacterium]